MSEEKLQDCDRNEAHELSAFDALKYTTTGIASLNETKLQHSITSHFNHHWSKKKLKAMMIFELFRVTCTFFLNCTFVLYNFLSLKRNESEYYNLAKHVSSYGELIIVGWFVIYTIWYWCGTQGLNCLRCPSKLKSNDKQVCAVFTLKGIITVGSISLFAGFKLISSFGKIFGYYKFLYYDSWYTVCAQCKQAKGNWCAICCASVFGIMFVFPVIIVASLLPITCILALFLKLLQIEFIYTTYINHWSVVDWFTFAAFVNNIRGLAGGQYDKIQSLTRFFWNNPKLKKQYNAQYMEYFSTIDLADFIVEHIFDPYYGDYVLKSEAGEAADTNRWKKSSVKDRIKIWMFGLYVANNFDLVTQIFRQDEIERDDNITDDYHKMSTYDGDKP